MAHQILSNLDFNSASRITNLPDGASNQEPATVAQLNAAVEGLAWKDSCRVSTQGNLNLSSPGATIDGVTMASGDRVLVRQQTTASENGIYVWNGAAVAATRSLDASTAAELEQAVTTVEEATDAGTTWRQTAVNFTLGSGSVTWSNFGTSAPAASTTVAGVIEIATQSEVDAEAITNMAVVPATLGAWPGKKRLSAFTFGDGSATQFDLTHNFNTRSVLVEVYRNSSPWDSVMCDVERNTVNVVRLRFSSAPSTNQFIALVLG